MEQDFGECNCVKEFFEYEVGWCISCIKELEDVIKVMEERDQFDKDEILFWYKKVILLE